jgi:iron complex transport system substrate-binding protein
MKTKNIVLVGIAVCAISLLLISPVLANEDDYTLDIYGNANEDDTIDMRDFTYTARIILLYEDETTLADANYDERVSVADMTQIGLIILGRESELTIIDATDRTVTLNMPINRIASSSMPQDIRTICALGAADKIVGVPDAITADDATDRYPAICMSHPELTELPIAGSPYYGGPNLEVIASLEPDLVIVAFADADAVQEAVGVPTIASGVDYDAVKLKGFKQLKTMGYVLNEQARAEELSSYFNEKIDEVTEVTSDMPDYEKPEVYLAFWGDITYTPAFYGPVEPAGGVLVAEEGTPGPYDPMMWIVSKEQVIAWNPDIILIHSFSPGTHIFSIEDVLSDPDLWSIPAVANEKVYYTKGFQFGWDPATGVIECFYMAKLFHPGEFADFDVMEKGDEILEEVYGADGIWTEMTELFDLHTW